ncbi:MAG TPA: hypothetical protein VIC85_12525 [Ktedonobacterales bacterium]
MAERRQSLKSRRDLGGIRDVTRDHLVEREIVQATLEGPKAKSWIPRLGVASISALAIAIIATLPAYADCYDAYNSTTYCSSYGGCTDSGGNFFAMVQTQSGACVWSYDSITHTYDAKCPTVYDTEGAKGNLTTGGSPKVYGTADHVNEWMESIENFADCAGYNKVPQTEPGCWVQVGWGKVTGVRSARAGDR